MKIYKTAQIDERQDLLGLSNGGDQPPSFSQEPTGDPESVPSQGKDQAQLKVNWENLNDWYLTGGDELPDPLPTEGIGSVIINYNYDYSPYDSSLDIKVTSVWVDNILTREKQILYVFEDYYDDEIKDQFFQMSKNI